MKYPNSGLGAFLDIIENQPNILGSVDMARNNP